MKKSFIFWFVMTVFLTGPVLLRAYDNGPHHYKVVPECIWSAATGGGTWVTEIQITNFGSDPATSVNAIFIYDGGSRSVVLTPSLSSGHSVNYPNILQQLQSLDAGFSYYGRVGAVWFWTSSPSNPLHVTAKTTNGNYGKTFPGLSVVESNTAAEGRPMIIPLLKNSATYRTFVGFFNTASNTLTYNVTFSIKDKFNNTVGSFTKNFPPYAYMTFNPFVEAGIGGNVYDECFLDINPTSGGSNALGIMGFGAIANNLSNDPAALIAYQSASGSTLQIKKP